MNLEVHKIVLSPKGTIHELVASENIDDMSVVGLIAHLRELRQPSHVMRLRDENGLNLRIDKGSFYGSLGNAQTENVS